MLPFGANSNNPTNSANEHDSNDDSAEEEKSGSLLQAQACIFFM